ncbi:MAG TPA: alpha/beta hydrolase [Acidimicrobiia bacterium]|nr:alpha/beta hydrolase [Acidimicrobiia bacterium]
MSPAMVTAAREDPVWIDSGDETIFAMVTHPRGTPSETGVVLLPGGSWMPSTMRNRMYVDLARRIAAAGVTTVRIDYQGVGESTGETPFFDLTRPPSTDVAGATKLLQELGCRRIIAVGSCFGGRAALSVLSDHPSLVGLVMSASPVEDYPGESQSLGWHARKALSRETLRNLKDRYPKYVRIIRKKVARWLFPGRGSNGGSSTLSPDYVAYLQRIVDRGIPTLILHGSRDRHFLPFQRGIESPVGAKLMKSGVIQVEVRDGELHGELTIEAQRFASDRIERFVVDLIGDAMDLT